jgi:hypothetical protein
MFMLPPSHAPRWALDPAFPVAPVLSGAAFSFLAGSFQEPVDILAVLFI